VINKTKGSELFNRQIASCDNELMQKVWSVTPWMINADTGSINSGRYMEIRGWCNSTFGREAWPIHEIKGNWQNGGATVYGQTWMGFKTEEMMNQFRSKWEGE